MTEDQLAAIEARADAATPGPWYAIPNPDWAGANWRIARDPNEPWANFGQIAYVAPHNGQFIAEARADIPALVAEVRRLQRENAVYEAAVALAETCELGCGDYGGNIFDDELLLKYREARMNAEDGA